MEVPENMKVSKPTFDNRKFESENLLQARNNALNYLKTILKSSIDNKKIIFKNPKQDIFKDFDLELIKNKNGEYDLEKIHYYPLFFSDWQIKISLFYNGKEIFRIGNIDSLEDYETLLNHSKTEFENNALEEQTHFSFHTIPFQNFYLFSKIIKDKSCNRTIISDEDMQLIMKII